MITNSKEPVFDVVCPARHQPGTVSLRVGTKGNRIELVGQVGYHVFDPTWEPVCWRQGNLENAIIWQGSPLPGEFDYYRTPSKYVHAEASLLLGDLA